MYYSKRFKNESFNRAYKNNKENSCWTRSYISLSIFLCIPLVVMCIQFSNYPFSERISSSPIRSDLASIPLNESIEVPMNEGRIAICLVGGLRRFELTGPTLQANLFPAFENADIFIVTPFDSDAFKLWVITGSNVVAVKLVNQLPVPEDKILLKVIHEYASSIGRQGLMYYSSLVERCARLIETYEYKHEFKYDWILRTRPDGLWSAPPSLPLRVDKLYLPIGSDWAGYNDRFLLGKRDFVIESMNWVSSLPNVYQANHSRLTAEVKYMALLDALNLSKHVELSNVSFCVLTEKSFDWPLGWEANSFFSASMSPIDAPEDGGGRYCRPCEPVPEIPVSKEIAFKLYHTTTFCNSSDNTFVSNWRDIYDKFYGIDIASKRKLFEENDNFWSCLKLLETFVMRVKMWESKHDPFAICYRHYNSTL